MIDYEYGNWFERLVGAFEPRVNKALTAARQSKHAAGSKKQKPATYTKQRQNKRHATKATWRKQGRS